MKLHKINHDLKTTLWCGPAALAALTGLPTSRVMAVLRGVTGQKVVQGVTNSTLQKAGELLGLRFVPQPVYPFATVNGLPTLAKWTAANTRLLSAGAVIVNVTDHYVTVRGRSFIDNGTRKPVSLKRAPHRRARVRAAWHVVPIVGFVPAPVALPPPRPAPRLPGDAEDQRRALEGHRGFSRLEPVRQAAG